MQSFVFRVLQRLAYVNKQTIDSREIYPVNALCTNRAVSALAQMTSLQNRRRSAGRSLACLLLFPNFSVCVCARA
jgi:hypothetical protein